MKILFHLAHPAQYHMFKYVIKNLIAKGHKVNITINTKDILEKLLIADGIAYENILPKRRKRNNKRSAIFTLIKKDIGVLKVQLKSKFDMFVGTETALAHIGWLFRIPVLIMDEDDIEIIPEVSLLNFPFATHIVAPISCNMGKWTRKKIAYKGFQKLAYLHPNYFEPDRNRIADLIHENEKYFLIRVSDLSAYHDTRTQGFTLDLLRKLIALLLPKGKVIISTEKHLPDDLTPYCHSLNISDIHHYLYFAELLIADSQSMCVEAAVLGTPSLRYSDFAGRIGVLEELEHDYGLTYGFRVNNSAQMILKMQELLNTSDLKEVWKDKREKMLSDKIDVTSFWTYLIDEYPKSLKGFK